MAYKLSYLISDDKGRTATTSIHVPEGFTFAQYESFSTAFIAAIRAVISGVLRTGQLCLTVPISGIDQTGKPTVTSDVENVGEFIAVSENGFRTVVNVPGLNEALVASGSDALIFDDPAVENFNNFLVDGFEITTGVFIEPVDIGGDDIVGVLSMRERFRNSGPAR